MASKIALIFIIVIVALVNLDQQNAAKSNWLSVWRLRKATASYRLSVVFWSHTKIPRAFIIWWSLLFDCSIWTPYEKNKYLLHNIVLISKLFIIEAKLLNKIGRHLLHLIIGKGLAQPRTNDNNDTVLTLYKADHYLQCHLKMRKTKDRKIMDNMAICHNA